jgi:hypothetical protein
LKKVSVFAVGAPKCGTTSLYSLLSSTLEIDCGTLKESHFFSNIEVKNSYYDVKVISSLDEYEKNYTNDNMLRVDCSPSYLSCETSAKDIFEYNSDAKIIVLIRDPLKRALSHYHMDLRLGYVSKGFRDAILEPQHYKEYILNSMYCKNIEAYTTLFGAASILIMAQENLNTTIGITNLLEFCEVSIPPTMKPVIANKAWNPRFDFVIKIAKFNSDYSISTRLPKRLRSFFKQIFTTPAPVVDVDLYSDLRMLFEDEYELLQAITKGTQ